MYAYAAMRRIDDSARAIFQHKEDATAYAKHMNDNTPFAAMFDSGAHIWTIYEWVVEHDTFEVED